jgi:hypothetical protein
MFVTCDNLGDNICKLIPMFIPEIRRFNMVLFVNFCSYFRSLTELLDKRYFLMASKEVCEMRRL